MPMRGLPLALIVSVSLWAVIVELAVGLATLAGEAPAPAILADIAAAAPAVLAAAVR